MLLSFWRLFEGKCSCRCVGKLDWSVGMETGMAFDVCEAAGYVN